MPDDAQGPVLGRSPLTDPRSIASSTLAHAALVALASLVAVNVSLRNAETPARTIKAELGPVDNKADDPDQPSREGGGAPGEIGGLGDPVPGAKPPAPTDGLTRDPAADELLSEILPKAAVEPDATLDREVPDVPIASGLVPGPGQGGGGGRGGGSGGGVGRGVGPGTEFFGSREHGTSFAYVIDCSGTMGRFSALEVAKRELLTSLDRLPPDTHFSVIFYDLQARKLTDVDGRRGMMAATAGNKAKVRAQLATIPADGGTDHMLALRTALVDRPEVIFFLTDAAAMSDSDVDSILIEAGKSRIQSIEFGLGRNLAQATPLSRLSTTSGGSYHYIDVTQFPRTRGR